MFVARIKSLRAKVCIAVFMYIGGMLALSACAPSQEFRGVPQQGAWRNGSYPKFSALPKAETAQLSAAEQQRLSQSLRADGYRVRRIESDNNKKQANEARSVSAKKQAEKEIENTLQSITGDQ